MTGPFIRDAARVLANGWTIVPIPKGSKGPIVPKWQALNLSTQDELRAFIEGSHEVEHRGRTVQQPNVRPNDGIGICTTHTPAVDIDCLDKTLAAAMETFVRDNIDDAPVRVGMWPKRLLVFRTDKPFSKVVSASFVDPANPTKNGKPLAQRIEVLGDGQQFVAYHTHPDTGKPYTWTEDLEEPLCVRPDELPTLDEDQANGICREFERLCTASGWTKIEGAKDSNAAGSGDDLGVAMPPDEDEHEVGRVKSALEHISADCSRLDYLEVLSALRWTGWICAEELARTWAEGSKEGKFDENHFDRDWKSLKQDRGSRTVTLGSLYHQAKQGGWDASRVEINEAIRSQAFADLLLEADGLARGIDRSVWKDLLKRVAAAALDQIDVNEICSVVARRVKLGVGDVRRAVKEFSKANREHGEPTHANYARRLLRKMEEDSGSDPVGVEGKLWVYDKSEGIWTGRQPGDYEVEVAREFDGLDGCARRTDYLAIANHAYIIAAEGRISFFENAPIGMACQKLFYRMDEGKIVREELGAEHRQRVSVDVVPKTMKTPLWDKLMAAAFKGDTNREQELLLEEYAGACLMGFAHKFEKVLFMKGVGRAGKGTIMKIIGAMVPADATSATAPDAWSKEYYLADLAGKRLNVVGELSDESPVDSAAFKRVTGRDELTGRHPAQRPFKFRNTAGHIFNANNFVYTKDHTDPFYARWLMMEFRNSMIGRDGEIDPNLAEKIIECELPGVCARFLQGAKRLLDRGHFVLTGPHHALMQQWRHRSSTVMEFINDSDVCVRGEFRGLELSRATFYAAYSAWCRESNRKPLGKQKMYEEMGGSVVASLGIRFAIKSGGVTLVRGLALRTMLLPSEVDDGAFDDL